MQKDNLQLVAYIGLNTADEKKLISVPLYVKVNELNKHCITNEQEALIHEISQTMQRRYEKQISEFFQQQKGANL